MSLRCRRRCRGRERRPAQLDEWRRLRFGWGCRSSAGLGRALALQREPVAAWAGAAAMEAEVSPVAGEQAGSQGVWELAGQGQRV